MSKAKQKGTLAETAVVQYLKSFFPRAERRPLYGVLDRGDISGVPSVVIEIKNQRTYKLPAWIAETEKERINAEATFGILIVKPNGVGVSNVKDWWAIVPLSQMVDLLQKADPSVKGLLP
jgi:hypothetical protein